MPFSSILEAVLDFFYEIRPELAKFAYFEAWVLVDPTHLGPYANHDEWVIFTNSRSLAEGGPVSQCYCLILDKEITLGFPLAGDGTQRDAFHRISVLTPLVDYNRPTLVTSILELAIQNFCRCVAYSDLYSCFLAFLL